MNPYDPPDTESSPTRIIGTQNWRTNLRSLLIPTFVGAVIGSIVLAPLTRGPGDPTGHGIAFGLGGLISLLAAIIFRAVARSIGTVADTASPCATESDIPQQK